MVVKAVKRATQKTAPRKTARKVTKPARATRKAAARKKPASPGKQPRTVPVRKQAAGNRKHGTKQSKPTKKPAPKKPVVISGRVAAPEVRLGMTPHEVRETTGKPECILFGSDDHVEWQFGMRGFDVVGAPTLYVTTLTFASGRVVRITERMSEALA